MSKTFLFLTAILAVIVVIIASDVMVSFLIQIPDQFSSGI